MSAAAAKASSKFIAQLQPGQKLAGCYLLQRPVSGATLPLWLAHDEVLGKDISLQFLPADLLAQPGVADRLRQEVKRARQLIHPRILRVYDLVEEEEFTAVAMDSFAGQPLSMVVESQQRHFFEVSEVWPVAREVCETLGEAHRLRLVHGGLSMSDVLVGDGHVKLMNFAVTAALHEAAPKSIALPLASPQQIDGARPTAADDIYAFGALVHTLLVGAAPFTGADRPATPLSVSEHRRELGRKGAEVPQSWEQIIAACLQRDPASRPANPSEIAAKLEAGATGASEPPPAPIEATAAAGAAAAASAVGAASAASAAAGSTSPTSSTPSEAPSLEAPSLEAPSLEAPSLEAPEAAAPIAAAPTPAAAAESEPPAAAAKTESPAADPDGKESTEIAAAAAPEAPLKSTGREKSAAPAESPGGSPEAPSSEGAAQEKIDAPAPESEAAPVEAEVMPRQGRPGRRVRPTGRAAAGGVPAVDEKELAETVRREEAAGEAGVRNDLDDDFAFSRRSEGPSLVTIGVIAGVLALIGFFIYRAVVGGSDTERRDIAAREAEATPQASSSTPASIAKTAPDPTPASVASSTPASPATQPTPSADVAQPSSQSSPASPGSTATVSPQEGASTTASTTGTMGSSPASAPPAESVEEGSKPATPEVASSEQLAAALADLKRTLETTNKELPAAKKATAQIVTQQKKLDEDAAKAERAATEAEKAAAEKKRIADEARQNATTTAEKLAAQQAEIAKRETEVKNLQAQLAETERALAEAKKAEAARKAAAAAAPTPAPDTKSTSTAAASPSSATGLMPTPTAVPEDARTAFEQKMKELGNVLSGKATPTVQAGASPAPAPAMELAKATTPKPESTSPAPVDAKADQAKTAAADGAFTNSLGMKFVPVPGGEGVICIWPTRIRDFEVFAKSAGLRSSLWRDPGFKQGPDHPVVNVSWQEAVAFCKWLTGEEQKKGLISAKQSYRLPTDLEWSRAAGLENEKGATPESRDMGVPDVYPWGTAWPPPPGAGNYTGEETGSDVAIRGYNDGFPWTSPVGSFPPNKYGLYDMGGNVWQWCMDSWNAESRAKVLRGASWYNGALKLSLLTSCRVHASPDSSTDNYGFRIVLGGTGSSTSKK